LWLGSFVADGAPNFIYYLWWNFVHVVIFASMLGTLLQNVLVSLSLRHKVAVHPHVSTADCFCHVISFDAAYVLTRGILVSAARPMQPGLRILRDWYSGIQERLGEPKRVWDKAFA
jgi:hypothetical protein